MAHFTFIIYPAAYFSFRSSYPRFVFVLTYPPSSIQLQLQLQLQHPHPHPMLQLSYADCNCIACSCVFFAARVSFIYVSHFPHFPHFSHFLFFFRHESTSCKIQLKIVECKLISALGYANYAANESPSSADIYTFTPIIVSI